MTIPKPFRIAFIIVAILVAVALVIVAAIYLWPLRTDSLQTSTPQSLTYNQAIKQHADIVAKEKSDGVLDDCTSKLYTHSERTKKAVVLFHGVTACPNQFNGLAKTFFDAGYNVYAPRTPYHGFADKKSHAGVRAIDLVNYVNQSVTITTGLGEDIGAAGLSGGGMLTTWASEYRPEVKRALVMSPFYEPAAAQAPKWQLPLLNVLYGFHIVPDQFSTPSSTPGDVGFSYRALANYNIVTKNLKSDPRDLSLKSFAVMISDDDNQIDLDLARSIPQKIADANPSMTFIRTNLPVDWKLGHDIVSLDNKNVATRSEQLFNLYFNAYEGRKTDL